MSLKRTWTGELVVDGQNLIYSAQLGVAHFTTKLISLLLNFSPPGRFDHQYLFFKPFQFFSFLMFLSLKLDSIGQKSGGRVGGWIRFDNCG